MDKIWNGDLGTARTRWREQMKKDIQMEHEER
jgi:hypothetical protein